LHVSDGFVAKTRSVPRDVGLINAWRTLIDSGTLLAHDILLTFRWCLVPESRGEVHASKKFRFAVCHWGIALLLALQGGWVLAQLPDKLPQAPDYLGEIRRAPSGELKAMPEAAQSAEAAATATMIVGHGEKFRRSPRQPNLPTMARSSRFARAITVVNRPSGRKITW
jgi:hypothetical protein